MNKQMVNRFRNLTAQTTPIHQNMSTTNQIINSQNTTQTRRPHKEGNLGWRARHPNTLPRIDERAINNTLIPNKRLIERRHRENTFGPRTNPNQSIIIRLSKM
ncbi:hypothetical protein CsSME_00035070 [Camellia sinensis var. sinensis]